MVRLVYLEPPPPPPAPLGVAGGIGAAPAQPVSQAPPGGENVRVENPAESLPAVADRLRKAEKRTRPKPRPAPPAVEPAATTAAPVDLPAGAATGSIGGETEGVVGGSVGGIAGGVGGGAGSGPIPAGQVAQPPVLMRKVAPVYPSEARQREIEGLVVLEAVLDREGRVEPGVKVLQSLQPLDREAISAVQKWRFRPARDAQGNPLRVILEIPIRFVLR